MRTITAAAAVFAAFATIPACGGSTSPTNNPGESATCTVTLSGAVSGTYDCKPATTVWSSANNRGGFSFSVGTSGSTPNINVAIAWTGEPAAGTHYQRTDAGAQGGVTLITGSGAGTQVWEAVTGNNATGSYDLDFTSVSNALSTANGKAYTADGALDATLNPTTGQNGSVTVHVSF